MAQCRTEYDSNTGYVFSFSPTWDDSIDEEEGNEIDKVRDQGDNSTNSSDSRHYGSVPAALVVGKVLLRIWPLRGNALILRGPRPLPSMGNSFNGSTLLHTGYEGEAIQ